MEYLDDIPYNLSSCTTNNLLSEPYLMYVTFIIHVNILSDCLLSIRLLRRRLLHLTLVLFE